MRKRSFSSDGAGKALIAGFYPDAKVVKKLRFQSRRWLVVSRSPEGKVRCVRRGAFACEEWLQPFEKWVFPGEAGVLVETSIAEVRGTIDLLRREEAAAPSVFAFPIPGSAAQAPATPNHARSEGKRSSITGRLRVLEDTFGRAHRSLSMAAEAGQGVTVSAEWLLDNSYLIQEQINDVRADLPESYYGELPGVSKAPRRAGEPRICLLASRMVADGDTVLNGASIRSSLEAWQQETPLTVGELWAMPQVLRLRLVERLCVLAVEVQQLQRESEDADFWANRLLAAARRSPEGFAILAADLMRYRSRPSPHFASELMAHLYDEEAALPLVSGWLERSFGQALVEVFQLEDRRQAAQQVQLGNLVTSCRHLSQLQWPELIEQVCLVDARLSADPAGAYSRMAQETRELYRKAVEQIGKWAGAEELDIAAAAIARARNAGSEAARHVGYHLIDDGRRDLERKLGCRVPRMERARRALRRHAAPCYLGGVFILTTLLTAFPVELTAELGRATWLLWGLGLLVLLPASELAVQIVNFAITRFLPANALPKMDFGKGGIPDEYRTLIVVPMMLTTAAAIRNELERIEVRHVSNPDPNLRFALLSDFSDAPARDMPEDPELLEIATTGIEKLNERYGEARFLLFHRNREWSESEQRWIGWERKRGKLEQLNRLLAGDPNSEDESLLAAGEWRGLEGIRFVITLDADTQLPLDAVRRLVETLAHPLNRPVLSPDESSIERGYAIIQPSVSTALPSANASWFTRLFADIRGLDPYTRVVSDIYQDLTGEGSYLGKGIYDVQTMHRLNDGRFPQAHLLSHDLLEGGYARTALATDIELLDVFPGSYVEWWWRQHRWTRGDWQIVDWLAPRVPCADGGKCRNSLSIFNRWKIFDNLRRSLVPIPVLIFLIAGWFFAPRPAVASMIAAGLLLWPLIGAVTALVLNPPPPGTRFWRGPRDALLRSLVAMTFLVDYAHLAFDAVARVGFRRLVTRRHFLEWETAQDAHHRVKSRRRQFILARLWIPAFCAIVLVALGLTRPAAIAAAAPYLLLWATTPLMIAWLDRPAFSLRGGVLTPGDRRMLRSLARRTWRYFDEFVGPETHWLPPDNFQETPIRELFLRTSPTNIGLGMLSAVTAADFGYITPAEMIERNLATLDTLRRLELFEGHLLNWYDIATLEPLHPRYVSTVDSGNLLAALWTLEAVCDEIPARPLLDAHVLSGLGDTLAVLRETRGNWSENETDLQELEEIAGAEPRDLQEMISCVRAALQPAKNLALQIPHDSSNTTKYWAERICRAVEAWNGVIDDFLRPVEILGAAPTQLGSLGESAHERRRAALAATFSLKSLAMTEIPGMAELLMPDGRDSASLPAHVREWLGVLKQETSRARENAQRQMEKIGKLLDAVRCLGEGMNLRFLYDEQRRLFSIGYHVAERRLDGSFYDLLASEARLTSLLAIAKQDAPVEHWWALSRPFGQADGRMPLLSWTGTMFEYLMPELFTRTVENSLLDRACHDAVHCQMAHGRRLGVPWGISESAFSELDRHHVYQYRAFGAPALALKREQDRKLVISPYSSVLALGVAPMAAAGNLRRIAGQEGSSVLGDYGFCEAVDYTRRFEARGKSGILVRCYMAHHQGMSMLALGNALLTGIVRTRFHSRPRIRAVETLLYERVPESILPTTTASFEERPSYRITPITGATAAPPHTPDTSSPLTHLLSNGNCSAMVTNSGGGFLRWRDFDVTRWHADATCDAIGSVCYIRDTDTDDLWSATHLPIPFAERHYSWSFALHKAEFRRRSGPCEALTELTVSAEDDAEVRKVTLVNVSRKPCSLEITSYVELALAPHRADRAHPAFSKLFVETEWLPEWQALLAHRRIRSPHDAPVWTAHLMVIEEPAESPQFETSRLAFLGRGTTLENPEALRRPLASTVGFVLDPIFSLRRRVVIPPSSRYEFALVTLMAESREKALELVRRYADIAASRRAFETAQTRAQLALRRLRATPSDARLFQQLASALLFPQARLRPPRVRLGRGTNGQAALWAQGLSGDLPIVAVSIVNRRDSEVVRQLLAAHMFWHLQGVKADLLILSEDSGGYDEPLTAYLRQLIEPNVQITGADRPGGVFLRSARKIPVQDRTALLAAAHVVFVAARGALQQQLALPEPSVDLPGPWVGERRFPEEPSPPLSFVELRHFNGLGGFTPDGREYVIYLAGRGHTPAPWVNVIANPLFGTMVSECGTGFTWAGNSQLHRLTPWSNDPVMDPPAEAIYLRDEDLGAVWSPTPSPIRELDAYRVRHGQGYTICEHNSHAIEQELLTFVPSDSPVRIQRLRLRNVSSHFRRLTVTAFNAWVLGTDPEETQMHLTTRWDLEGECLFARNVYHPDFSGRVAFFASSPRAASFTGDRTEFIGRNRTMSRPAALGRTGLSNRVGPGLDPCAALQLRVDIEPGDVAEVVFLLGDAGDEKAARELVRQFRDPAQVEESLRKARARWDEVLNAIQVETPEPSADLLLNRWLLYQTLGCRVWGRSAFYQSGGAYGFRDQLQDVMALVHAAPHLAREHILRAASRQFVEGDVQHWWHPDSGAGVRTRISDDMLWLPFATAHYVRVTGDAGILDEPVPFLEGEPLEATESEKFSVPSMAREAGPLLEHCRRAIEKASTSGPHGLPLIGGGDWNDGFNRLGLGGKGESVWLAWFQICVLADFAELLEQRGAAEEGRDFRVRALELAGKIEANAWDGRWYRRAYFDDGTPLGSNECAEARIDSLPQSWAAISGAADARHLDSAMKSLEENLIHEAARIVMLFTPPLDKTPKDVGYIKGYPPGVRENGGQYTHAATWVALAFARRGEGKCAVEVLQMLNPVEHAKTEADTARYKVEPYAVAADVYALEGQFGRGGWTWYTGAAGWIYRVWLEEILGLHVHGDQMTLRPVIPATWPGFRLRYQLKRTTYEIHVRRSEGEPGLTEDGASRPSGIISLRDDGGTHRIELILGSAANGDDSWTSDAMRPSEEQGK
jgi:cellobiose phosphorylase